jgi:hypothetical protein
VIQFPVGSGIIDGAMVDGSRTSCGLGLLLLAMASVGCAAPQPKAKKGPGALSKRATFDLNCPGKQLVPVDIDENTVGVRGCGRRAVYVYVCENARPAGAPLLFEKKECRWLRQGEVQEDEE